MESEDEMFNPSNNNQNKSFYETLNEIQKQRVEDKLNRILGNAKQELDESEVHNVRCQIASDLFQILKG